jgi:hypothetical protein
VGRDMHKRGIGGGGAGNGVCWWASWSEVYVVSIHLQRGTAPMFWDVGLWLVHHESCTPGTARPAGGCLSEGVELRELLEGVAVAGSWAVSDG